MQTWMPPPNPMCSEAFTRPTSKRSGSGNTRGSSICCAEEHRYPLAVRNRVAGYFHTVLEHPALEKLERGS
jgi:hypothetical protein